MVASSSAKGLILTCRYFFTNSITVTLSCRKVYASFEEATANPTGWGTIAFGFDSSFFSKMLSA